MLSKENLKVLTNIIGAVESGGQIYGKRNYAAYVPPYTNSDVEHTITLGWAQNYGRQAKRLIERIRDADPVFYMEVSEPIREVMNKDWITIRWNPDKYQQKALIDLIDSVAGHQCQDELFEELMRGYITDCEAEYTNDVEGVMMYCEIRHLGGKGPVDRIFKRCNGNYGTEYVLASLLQDQYDTTSDNQVGDKKFWTRHVKCAGFIDQYANQNGSEIKEDMPMAVLVGSARGDEYGEASGGRAGDQTGREVSTQEWYYHSKGWVGLRAKDDIVAEKIAYAMERACANNKIGYDQGQRDTLYSYAKKVGFDPGKVTTACETDCSALVRVCLAYAGVMVGDIYTGNLRDTVMKTGKFTQLPEAQTKSAAYMKRGDILVTKTVGHTVVVLGTGSKVKAPTSIKLKTLDEIAAEVIDGKWGNGDERREALVKAGYNYDIVRAKVNELIAKGSDYTPSKPSSEYPKHGVVNVSLLNVRQGPDKSYDNYHPYPLLREGNEVDVLGKEGNFYKIMIAGQHTAYASAQYIDIT